MREKERERLMLLQYIYVKIRKWCGSRDETRSDEKNRKECNDQTRGDRGESLIKNVSVK